MDYRHLDGRPGGHGEQETHCSITPNTEQEDPELPRIMRGEPEANFSDSVPIPIPLPLDRVSPDTHFYEQESRSQHNSRGEMTEQEQEHAKLMSILKSKPEENLSNDPSSPDYLPRPPRDDVESIGSNYSPSIKSDDDNDDDDEANDALHLTVPHRLDAASLVSSQWSPRKRPRGLSLPDGARPFKRARGAFSREYVNLLNRDIQDAAMRFVPHDGPALPPSQVGLTCWTVAEKELFFEALARLDPRDAAGIAARIESKSEFEVAQYLRLLQDSAAAKKLKKDRGRPKDQVLPADFPAAVELSQACCNALEEAADSVSVRQETYEESLERKRWGDDSWLVTLANYAEIEQTEPPKMKSAGLFRLKNWLVLSDLVFMNANFPENNWTSISAEEPAIRATALEDFYSLVVSITKRLVAATIYASESRIRSQSASKRVWRQDVQAAALSIGLPINSCRFWAGAARRLRLDIYDDDLSTVDEDGQLEPMSYDAVEAELLGFGGGNEPAPPTTSPPLPEDDEDNDEKEKQQVEEYEDKGEQEDELETDQEQPEPRNNNDLYEKAQVKREFDEFIESARFVVPRRDWKPILRRIQLAHRQEAYASELDGRASRLEERAMWKMVRKPPPPTPSTREGKKVKLEDLSSPPPLKRVKETVEDFYAYYNDPDGGDGGWKAVGATGDGAGGFYDDGGGNVAPSNWEMDWLAMKEEEARQEMEDDIGSGEGRESSGEGSSGEGEMIGDDVSR
ncbi:hypothetical protein B0H66DRAFT_557081 [Apodospora peruviana]|uniref:Myb-like domain-containing protein n=1 Tax=Apodospora peruviana TaxID=516989 RepID=A0AAE0I4Z8_9PEZI|nr:hypothetical protein B0H66DRAFT_557081 [Apodospora peruviana]